MTRSRRIVSVRPQRWGAFGAVLGLAAAAAAGAGDREGSLARFVPEHTGLFVEARDAWDLLIPLTEPQVWTTLAELAGQPSRPEDVEAWRQQILETVKMEPAHAIRVLFGQRVAFAGEGPGRTQDAVVLCRPLADIPTADWLRLFQAQPDAGLSSVPVYRLKANFGLIESDHVLIFGDLTPREGMFRDMLRFVERRAGRSLAEAEDYRRLLERTPDNPTGVLFARLGPRRGAPASAPATGVDAAHGGDSPPTESPPPRSRLSELPGPFRGASALLLALHRTGPLLHFTAVGDGDPAPRPRERRVRRLVDSLPERTLIAWEGRVNFPSMVRAVERLPENHAARVALELMKRMGVVERLLDAIEPNTCIAIGAVDPAEGDSIAPPAPAAAILFSARDAAAAQHELSAAVGAWVSAYSLAAVSGGMPAIGPTSTRPAGDATAHVIELSGLLTPGLRAALPGLSLCWAVDRDVLIVASHRAWLERIIESRGGGGATLAALMRIAQTSPSENAEMILVAQTGPLADLGTLWLRYLERTAPAVLTEGFWRTRQPGGVGVRLGVEVVEDAEHRRLRVARVAENAPAAGILESGDELVGCGRRRFATTQPLAEMRASLENRPQARWVELLIRRDEVEIVRRVPLPFVDPVQALRRVIAVGELAQRVVYHDDVPADGSARGFLTIELRGSPRPLYDFAPAASRPAVREANPAPANPPATTR